MSVKKQLRAVQSEFGTYPRLVVTVEGVDDVYRFARHLELGQCEFADMGRLTLAGMDRRWPGIVRAMVARMGPQSGYPGVKPRDKAVRS